MHSIDNLCLFPTRGSFRAATLVAIVVIFISTTVATASAHLSFETRALTGDPAPGAGPGVVFSAFSGAYLDASGRFFFHSNLSGAGVNNNNRTGLYSDRSGVMEAIARAGDRAPGTDLVFDGFGNYVFNASGQAAFYGSLRNPGGGPFVGAIFSDRTGALGLVARNGDVAPGAAPAMIFGAMNTPINFSAAGHTAFLGTLTAGEPVNDDSDTGIFTDRSGSLQSVARTGDAAPGMAPGVQFSTVFPPVINPSGRIAFAAKVEGPGVNSTNDRALYSDRSGALSLVIRSGDPAPGTAPGVVFGNYLNSATMNGAGQLAFRSFLAGAGVTQENDRAIYVERSGTLELVAREGSAAPSAGAGVVFELLDSPRLNSAGQTAFFSTLSGPNVSFDNDFGLFSEQSGSLELVAREGDPAPGMGPDVVFGGFNLNSAFNGLGQIAFVASISGPGITDDNNQSLWATDPEGLLMLIGRKGDLFDVNNDPMIEDLRTISTISIAHTGDGEDGRPIGFNDAGQLAFGMGFTDGTKGIFVVTIPEPTTGVMFAIIGIWALVRRKKA